MISDDAGRRLFVPIMWCTDHCEPYKTYVSWQDELTTRFAP